MPRKKLTRPQLVRKLDKVFSKYVRLRDSDKDGYGNCITCGKRLHWKEAHAGHFIRRSCMPTRWHEWNVHLQGAGCNTYRGGEQARYLLALEDKHGREAVDELIELENQWKAGTAPKLSVADLREMIEEYKVALHSLEADR